MVKLSQLPEDKQVEIKALQEKISAIKDEGSFKRAYSLVRKETARIFKEGGDEMDKRTALVKACEDCIAMVVVE